MKFRQTVMAQVLVDLATVVVFVSLIFPQWHADLVGPIARIGIFYMIWFWYWPWLATGQSLKQWAPPRNRARDVSAMVLIVVIAMMLGVRFFWDAISRISR